MSNKEIEILNDVTKMLIDSQKGYEKAAEVTKDSFQYNAEFLKRASQRAKLIEEFQQYIRTHGGEPEIEGGMLGKLHRITVDFITLFQNDVEAALDAIDDGEEELAEKIIGEIDDGKEHLSSGSIIILEKALNAANEGENFAEKYSEAA